MEKALQDCCRSMRIGKILVDSDAETHEAKVIFAKFPTDIAVRYYIFNFSFRPIGYFRIFYQYLSIASKFYFIGKESIAALPYHENWQQSLSSYASFD